MANKKKISQELDSWVWDKWQEGYTQKDIANYLNVHVITVNRHIGRMQDQGKVLERDGRHKKSAGTIGIG